MNLKSNKLNSRINQVVINWFVLMSFSLCGFLITPIYCQNQYHSLLGYKHEIKIPFQYVNGFIVMDITIQKIIPLKFIFDTGAENTILIKKEYAYILGLPIHKEIKLLGADMSQNIPAFISNGVSLAFSNSETKRQNIIILDEDFTELDSYVGMRIDGILGASFIKDLVIQIDYKNGELTLRRYENFNPKKFKNFEEFEIEGIGSKHYLAPTVQVNTGSSKKLRMLIDTGAALTAIIHYNTDSLLLPIKGLIPGAIGKGLGGQLDGYLGKVNSLEFEPFIFKNLLCSFQVLDSVQIKQDQIIRNGIIGNLILERFEIILDPITPKLYLKAEKKYNRSYEDDKSGLLIFADGKDLSKFIVKFVTPNSPAAEAGFKAGDRIFKVGIWNYRWFTLAKINKKLSKKEGSKVSLTIQRGQEKIKKTLILRSLMQ